MKVLLRASATPEQGSTLLSIDLLAVGTNAPSWIAAGVDAYVFRMQRSCRFSIVEIKSADRKRRQGVSKFKEQEGNGLLAAVASGARVIALDSAGKHWSTEQFAGKLQDWSHHTHRFQFLVGGPDGLADACLTASDDVWSLSRLTFPHLLVRLILTEQIYRAIMLNTQHPYHR